MPALRERSRRFAELVGAPVEELEERLDEPSEQGDVILSDIQIIIVTPDIPVFLHKQSLIRERPGEATLERQSL